ncbi:MAG: PTS-dependent dihydroxyacetone kinase phosphotransferase subunit DhaM [Lachnospiraceae bacterium]|nr:PTS-dependent dihydroxyacetone kinase phosphotransferase subunit DhaM [Lachnospiraceae bacterium]
MVGIVIVSHSEKLAEGVVDVTKIMADGCPIAAAGGLEPGVYGTSFEKIMEAVESVHGEDGTLILMDMGSAVMTTEMVLEMLCYDDVKMVDCPIVEGAIAATIAAVGGADLDACYEAAVSAKDMNKL